MRRHRLLSVGLVLLALALGTPSSVLAQPTGTSVAERCFAETGHCLRGRFYTYWLEHGGLAINGYPISDPFIQTFEDGQSYLVQYCERVRLEYHPENAPPFDVLLGHLGRQIHAADPPASPRTGATYFRETGHNLSGAFRDYWLRNGGLMQFGYPTTEEISERLEDGRAHTVQYFERARFEKHPDNPPPYDLLLGHFGRRILDEVSMPPRERTGRILYLARDGVSIRSMRPDGSDSRLFHTITKRATDTVTSLSANLDGSAVLVGLSEGGSSAVTWYHLIQGGTSRRIAAYTQPPRWSADGTKFVGQLYSRAAGAINLYSYDVVRRVGRDIDHSGLADWFPGGRRLVYTDNRNVFTIDATGGTATPLTRLPTEAGTGWAIVDAHVLPDARRVIFFGGPIADLGASGNGMRWWWVPVTGGTPREWSEPEGNSVPNFAFSPTGAVWAYSGYFHLSACASGAAIGVMGTAAPGRTVATPTDRGILDLDSERLFFFNGMGWSPTGDRLVFGVTPRSCADFEPTMGEPSVYLWDATAPRSTATRKIADGAYPVWVR